MLTYPLEYVDVFNDLFRMIERVAEEGKKEDFSKLEEKTLWAIELRDCLTSEEKNAINGILSNDYIEFIRTGKYLDEIKSYIDEAKVLVEDNDEEIRGDILRDIFSGGMYDLSYCISVGIEEESVEMEGFFGKI